MVDGSTVLIDKEMVGLIRQLNKLGLKTSACCEGDKIHRYSQKDFAYVTIKFGDNQNFEYSLDDNTITLRWNRSQKKYINNDHHIEHEGWLHHIPEIIGNEERRQKRVR